jgi:hypothetical protein
MESNLMPVLLLITRMHRLQFFLFLMFLLQSKFATGQYNGNYWCFGDSAYIDWSNPQNPIVGSAAFYWRNGSSTIGDSSGLLLYASRLNNILPNNCCVWNRNNNIITDGDHIYGSAWYHSSLFIPDPGNDSIIYLFTSGVTNDPYGFYYSKINYKANGDSGVVIQKNVQLNNFPAFDGLMGVKHGNGRDWWVIFQRWYQPSGAISSDTFYVYLFTPSGLLGPFNQSIGSTHSTNLGHSVFSNEGNTFANISIRGLIELYNFDRCTGLITSSIPIEQEPATSPYTHWYGSCAFSPDDSKLYVLEGMQNNDTAYLWQFDLNASNIANSKIAIDSFADPLVGVYQLKLAPDQKIYLTAFDRNFGWPYPDTSTAYTTINNNLSVINYPDSLGATCDFQPFSFNLGTGRSYFGLPNNPDYELGAWVGSPCDTLTVSLTENDEKNDVFFQAWYNHEWNMIHVNASKLKGKSGVLRLFDLEGRVVYEREVEVIQGGYYTNEITVNGIASGVYIVSLTTEKDKVQSKVLKF